MSNKEEIRIAISGKSGCGNTTVSRNLAERLSLTLINYTFRNIAEEDGISFDEVTHRAEQSDEDDLRVDNTQVRLARQSSSVVGSRLAIWMLEEADLKVFLTASPETRAQRIVNREGGTLNQVMKETENRDKRDRKRYLKLYGIDNNDYRTADLIINTNRLAANEVVDIIEIAASAVMKHKKTKETQ